MSKSWCKDIVNVKHKVKWEFNTAYATNRLLCVVCKRELAKHWPPKREWDESNDLYVDRIHSMWVWRQEDAKERLEECAEFVD